MTCQNIATATAVLLLLSPVAFPQTFEPLPRVKKPAPRVESKAALLEKYDKNKNGRLDKIEIEDAARDRLRRSFDDNKDGRVDSFELRRGRAGVRKMPKTDALQRAMARERALAAAREWKRKAAEEKKQNK